MSGLWSSSQGEALPVRPVAIVYCSTNVLDCQDRILRVLGLLHSHSGERRTKATAAGRLAA